MQLDTMLTAETSRVKLCEEYKREMAKCKVLDQILEQETSFMIQPSISVSFERKNESCIINIEDEPTDIPGKLNRTSRMENNLEIPIINKSKDDEDDDHFSISGSTFSSILNTSMTPSDMPEESFNGPKEVNEREEPREDIYHFATANEEEDEIPSQLLDLLIIYFFMLGLLLGVHTAYNIFA